jgi:hypothetical protein
MPLVVSELFSAIQKPLKKEMQRVCVENPKGVLGASVVGFITYMYQYRNKICHEHPDLCPVAEAASNM